MFISYQWNWLGHHSIQVIRSRCAAVMNAWSVYVIPVAGDIEMSRVLPPNNYIIEGRCRDISRFTEKKQLLLEEREKPFKMILIEKAVPGQGSMQFSSSKTVIRFNSNNDVLTMGAIGGYAIARLCQLLKSESIDTILCSDAIQENLLFYFTSNGVFLVLC